MSGSELEHIVDEIRTGYQLRSERIGNHVKLLRSIEISALREAREIVERAGDDLWGPIWGPTVLADLDKRIRALELS